MVTSLTRELIRVEVQTNPQVILNTIREVIGALPIAGRQTQLSLHPDDLALVKQAYGEDNLAERHWTLQAEPALNRGDLQVHSGDSCVDYYIEDAFATYCNNSTGQIASRTTEASNDRTVG